MAAGAGAAEDTGALAPEALGSGGVMVGPLK